MAAVAEIKTLQEQFDLQLENFKQDQSYFADYARFTPLGEEVLVKLFKFIPEDNSEELGTTAILVWSDLHKDFVPKQTALTEKIFPIVKVIRVGLKINSFVDQNGDILEVRDSSRMIIKEGRLYTVPVNDVTGLDWNPDFMWAKQNFAQKNARTGMGKVNIPDDMPQKLPSLEKNWASYKFSMPDRVGDETEDDKLVYLIPVLKLKALYE